MTFTSKYIIVLLSFLFFQDVSGQDFAPVGAIWHYNNIESFFGPSQGYIKVESVKDTILKGIICKKIKSTRFYSSGNSNFIGYSYVYTDGGIVYRLASDSTFLVLYNFNALVGDS
ncbi:MAG TPA: hypothetical protein VK750_02435 [Cytophagaceae bacterium]|jgi:hypothetical protein|nr:hypothetical protein [Cytophagaceae bacterium]